jgi:hypothetical protein
MCDKVIRNGSESDHGAAYPEGVISHDGTVIFQSGQGRGHWSAMRFEKKNDDHTHTPPDCHAVVLLILTSTVSR